MQNKAPSLPLRQTNLVPPFDAFHKLPERSPLTAIISDPPSGFFPWQPKAWLRVTGDDAFKFLQGQFTNDLKGDSRYGTYGLWLTLKGKVMGDGFVISTGPNDYRIASYSTGAVALRERLESFIIADDVVVEDETDAWTAISLLGLGASEKVDRLRVAAPEGVAFAGRRSRPANVEWIFHRSSEPAVRAALGEWAKCDEKAIEAARILAGLPAVPADLGPNDLPNEAGVEVDAISYTKGCYLGQEVMARLKAMGQVRRRLLRVRGAGATVPAFGKALFAGGRQVGELRSAVAEGTSGFVGLAMVSLINLAGHRELALSAEGAPEIQLVNVP